jgi:aminoglycoside phosphotransferase (APT) family kinase protein
VAKIAPSFDASARELQLATSLVGFGAPVVPPIEIGIAQPAYVEGQWVTFWHHVADERTATAAEVADSLSELHAALGQISGASDLPRCQVPLKAAVELLQDPEFTGGLTEVDRALLRRALLDGIDALDSISGSAHVLHGSPHRFNILVTDGKAVFIDFETVELGPLEWDLAHLEDEVTQLYPAFVEQDLLGICRIAISAATSTWCWYGIDQGADMRSNAEQHLEAVRRSLS